MFKMFNIIDAVLTDAYSFLLGFRLSDWEIGQLLMMEIKIFDHLSKLPKSDDTQFRVKSSALRLMSWSHKLGFPHFIRGMRCLISRYPSSSDIFRCAIIELQKGIPIEFDEGQYLDHRYALTRSAIIMKSFPKKTSLVKPGSQLHKEINLSKLN